MGKITDLLIAESENYLSALFGEKLPEKIIYHDFSQALRLKSYAELIGERTGLNEDEMNILRVSALFHTAGYLNSFAQPQEEGAVIATAFLSGAGVEQREIDRVAEAIRATRLPQGPKDPIAEALCDAVYMYIASEDGLEQFDLLTDENALNKPAHKRSALERDHLEELTGHTYFTAYGRAVLQPAKEAALARITGRLLRRKLLEPRKETPEKPGIFYSRGVETMFRITARNQINLNSIADNKSNILISVNAIIISIIITMLAGNIGKMANDIVPVLVFLVICLATVIIAILSTRPNIVTRKFDQEDLKNKKVDLIFFGNFCKMDYDAYLDSMKEMMRDDEHLYSTLIRNQYELGRILSKKFRLVRIAYNVFMYGLILTVIVFLLNFLVVH